MTNSWYSIIIDIPDGTGTIFNGYFRVDNTTNLVTGFYERIGGSTDFNNNIYVNNGYDGEDSVFNSISNNFSIGGTNINYMNYFSNPASPGYNSSYAFFNLAFDEFNNLLCPLEADGSEITCFISLFSIASISDPSCFNEGTKILCLNNRFEDEYIPIENLRKGDLVKTYKHGYRKIDLIGKNPMINNPDIWHACMYKMEKTDDNGLIDDFIVTGGHSILVDDLGIFKEENDLIFGGEIMIDDKYLLLVSISKDFVKIENNDVYTYYHFALENNGNDDERFGVWANGILTETVSKNQFNSHKYTLF
jgi:hypothetical protein